MTGTTSQCVCVVTYGEISVTYGDMVPCEVICTCCDSGRNMLGITLVLGPNYILKCLYHMCRFCDDMAIICVHDGEPIFCSVVFFL